MRKTTKASTAPASSGPSSDVAEPQSGAAGAGAESDQSDDTLAQGEQPTKLPTATMKDSKRSDQDEGTDTARKFQIDADVIGGQHEDDAVEEGKVDPNVMRNWWARLRAKYPEPLAEFLCVSLDDVYLMVFPFALAICNPFPPRPSPIPPPPPLRKL